MKTLFALAAIMWTTTAFAADIAPFTSDGCSSFPDGTPANQALWLDCCIRHDLAYWQGGTYEQRLDADLALEHCVTKVGEPEIAKLMLQGVRAGGNPFFLTPYRWGYGWPFGRGYQSLTDEELAQVGKQLESLEQMLKQMRESLSQVASKASSAP
jgi:hypothetical protein